MCKSSLSIIAATFASFFALSASAQDWASADRFALGVGGGANGVVVDGSYRITPQWVVRGEGAFMDFSHGFRSGEVDYSGDAHFNTGGGYLDWHPATSPWFVTAGAISGQRKVDVNARPAVNGVITIHGVPYPTSEVGEVNGVIGYGDPVPVVGLGWDNTYYTKSRIGLRALLGVEFGQDPNVSLRAVGPFANNPTVLSDLAADEATLQRDARDYRYYPIAQVGLNYRF